MNLATLTEGKQVEGLLIFQSGFDTVTGIYYPGDRIQITISKNNLQSGYCGNTLLKKINPTSKRAEFDIRIDQFLFSKCSIEVKINQTLYGLSRKNGYLRLKAKMKGLK